MKTGAYPPGVTDADIDRASPDHGLADAPALTGEDCPDCTEPIDTEGGCGCGWIRATFVVRPADEADAEYVSEEDIRW